MKLRLLNTLTIHSVIGPGADPPQLLESPDLDLNESRLYRFGDALEPKRRGSRHEKF